MRFPDKMTIEEKYGPAMAITDQAEADAYFEACVEHHMRFDHSREKAEEIERMNLGYFAGYYDTETRKRVERLFSCAHPVFGSVINAGVPSAQEALSIGKAMGKTGESPL